MSGSWHKNTCLRQISSEPSSTRFPYHFGSGPSGTSPGSTFASSGAPEVSYCVSSRCCRDRDWLGIRIFRSDLWNLTHCIGVRTPEIWVFWQKHGKLELTDIYTIHTVRELESEYILPWIYWLWKKIIEILLNILLCQLHDTAFFDWENDW